MDISETQKAAADSKPNNAGPEKNPELSISSPDIGDHLPSDEPVISSDTRAVGSAATEATETAGSQKKQWHGKPRKLYQALARIEGSLEVKNDQLVLITQGDEAQLEVVQIVGKHTAMRLLKLPTNRRQGVYSLYPQVQGVKIINFITDTDKLDPAVPPTDQMFISGKLVSEEDGAFFVDIGRNKRTHKAKKQIEIPLRIEGENANPRWTIGQWIGLVLHREGAKWIWRGDNREVLRSLATVEAKKEG